MRTAIVSVAVYLTAVFGAAAQTEKTPGVKGGKAHQLQPKADPEASRLLTEASKNRAIWQDFPGFSADIEVNIDSKISKGKVGIDAKGGIRIENLDKAAERWAMQVLTTDIDHRLNAVGPKGGFFTDKDTDHPLGRSITLVGDGMGSHYRVRDKQIIVVQRQMEKIRFAITMMQTTFNKEGKYLPSSFIVHYWDTESGDLRKTDAYTHVWKRVGDFDLPATTRIVSTSRQVSVKSLALSNHEFPSKDKR